MDNILNFSKSIKKLLSNPFLEGMGRQDISDFTKLKNTLVESIANDPNTIINNSKYPVSKDILALDEEQGLKFFMWCYPDYIDEKYIRGNYFSCLMIALEMSLNTLLRRNLDFTSEQLILMISYLHKTKLDDDCDDICEKVLKIVERYLTTHSNDEQLISSLLTLSRSYKQSRWESSENKIVKRARDLAYKKDDFAVLINRGDAWSDQVVEDFQRFDLAHRQHWELLFNHCANASATKPSKTWLSKAKSIISTLGEENYISCMTTWLSKFAKPRTQTPEFQDLRAIDMSLMYDEHNLNFLKGLIWCSQMFSDQDFNKKLREAGAAAYKKVPNYGYRSKKIGNAIVYTLTAMKGRHGINELIFLRMKINQKQTLQIIDKALKEASVREGLSLHDLAELGVPAYGMQKVGYAEVAIGEYTAIINVESFDKLTLTWKSPQSKVLKSAPKVIKDAYPEEVTHVRTASKDIRSMLSTQKFRIEQLLQINRTLTYPEWSSRYLHHPLVGIIAQKLIWKMTTNNSSCLVFYNNGQLEKVSGDPVKLDKSNDTFNLWHPIESCPKEIEAWRKRLFEENIKQPFKQVQREIYTLNDDEKNSQTYSNRFASHILNQRQFLAISKTRGWNSSLQGAWDCDSIARIELPDYSIYADLQVQRIGDEDTLDSSGIYTFISSDQVRFYKQEDHSVIHLENLPLVVLSEVFRDIDLFVSVCSIGNNPHWSDGGLENKYQSYWYAFNYGNLSSAAVIRREHLQRIIPTLGMALKASFNEKYLIIEGTFHRYFIHIGSARIIIEPETQYINIPLNSIKKLNQRISFLPINGDDVLPIILSTAMLFADDDKITDPVILDLINPEAS